MPGNHNVSNATIAMSIALQIGLSFEQIKDALEEFSGIKRSLVHHSQ